MTKMMVRLGWLCLMPLLLAADKKTEDKTPSVPEGYATVTTAKTAKIRHDGSSIRAGTYLGINLELAEGKGFQIGFIDPQSPAAKAGLRVGDRLLKIEDEAVREVDQLRQMVQDRQPGDLLNFTIQRGEKTEKIKVRLDVASRPLTDNGQIGRRVQLGIFATPLDKGFRIDQVVASSPADQAGLKKGDVILAINDKPTEGSTKIADFVSDFNPGDRIMIRYRRDNKDDVKEVTLAPALTQNAATEPRGWDDRRNQSFRGDKYKLAVLPIEYPDQTLNTEYTLEEWERALFSDKEYNKKNILGTKVHGSLHDYYHEISGGKLDISGKVFEPVTVSENRKEYATGNRDRLMNEVIKLVLKRDGKDALKGYDGLFFMYAGNDIGTDRRGLYWAHQATITHEGERYSYFINPEGGDKIETISVISHEFGHLLGLPDLYAKPETLNAEGVGIWCNMANGQGKNGRPLHYSAWCKEQLDWIEPTLIDPTVPQKLVLSPIWNNPRECYKILVTPDASEYLLLENRVKQGFDQDLPGEGLLIWRIVDGRPQLEESHGLLGPDGPQRFLESVPYPTRSNQGFTPITQPSSKSQKRNARPVHITHIQRLPDGRITFQIGYPVF